MSSLNRLALLAAFLLTSQLQAELSPFERYELGQAEEAAMIEALAKKFTILQTASMHEGRKLRGTHAKGVCVNGEFEVFAGIDPRYQIGLFASPAVYSTRVRFANGASKIQSDGAPDARAISLSIDVGDGRKQDFAMNNGPIFPIGSLSDFNFLLDVGFVKAKAIAEATAAGSSPEEAEKAGERASYLFIAKHPTKIPGFIRTLKLGAELQNQPVSSYRNLKYWSGSAFKYGDHDVAKFVLAPCRRQLSEVPDRNDPDFLQKDLKQAVSDGADVCFDFQVQLLDAEKMRKRELLSDKKLPAWQWVEDVTLDWDAAGAVSYTVGRLSVTPGSVYADEACDDPIHAIDVMKNSLPEHRGLGRINRGRARSEAASKNNR